MTNSAQKPSGAEKTSRLTPEQISQLQIARRADGTSDDWVELYLAEFPENERRDVSQLRALLQSGKLVLHETRDKHGKLLVWSMSQDYASRDKVEPSFWLGCWTVTRRNMQSTGLGRIHFAKVLEALKQEKPDYIGRVTEIESTAGQTRDSQPVRRAKFYKALGLKEIDVAYEFPLFQPVNAKEYVAQAQLGKGIPAQLLIASFGNDSLSVSDARSIIKRIYTFGYHLQPTDPYIAERLMLVRETGESVLVDIRTNGS